MPRLYHVTALGFAVFAGFATLYETYKPLYFAVLDAFAFAPWWHPFVDAAYISAALTSWHRGVDVYGPIPNDLMRRGWDYSPLLLRLPAVGDGWPGYYAIGCGFDLAFCAGLFILPWPRGRLGGGVALAALASPAVLFGLERGNIDLGIFGCVALALYFLEQAGRTRFSFYALVAGAALIKFYPAALLLFAVRERRRVLAIIAAASGAVCAVFAALYGRAFLRALANVPGSIPFSDQFGAVKLPQGLAYVWGTHSAAGHWLLAVIAVCSAACAGWLAGRPAFGAAFAWLLPRAQNCLVAGSALFCICFCGQNYLYRAVFLLLTLPGLLCLAQADGPIVVRRAAGGMVGAVLGIFWAIVPLRWLGPNGGQGPVDRIAEAARMMAALAPGGAREGFAHAPFLAAWLAREVLSWAVFTVLLAVLVRVAWDGMRPLVTISRPSFTGAQSG